MACAGCSRLEVGALHWPQATNETVLLSQARLSMLLEGFDWRRQERTGKPEAGL
ncbi:IS66 family insertion sequence element accessory protein TnpB [Pseudoduganella plicata]|uniref:Transposase n=1 Tax=Pseudoduganella plicata TaxID=321984 RepID=A0ABX5S8Q1_9BURK|nr:hypothetical protein E1742_11590 [Pseudoduganella plicata]